MIKWILLFSIIGAWIWWVAAYTSEYPQISKQIDLKTMSLKKPEYIVNKWNRCVWTCRNYSSSSSYGWGSYGWK